MLKLVFIYLKVSDENIDHAVTMQQAGYINQAIKYYFIVRQKVDQGAGQLCLPHIGIEIELKHKNR